MPPQDGTIPVLTSPDERNIIYYTTYQGVTKTVPSKAKYTAVPDLGGPVVLVPGSYELTIELVKDSRGTYITLY